MVKYLDEQDVWTLKKRFFSGKRFEGELMDGDKEKIVRLYGDDIVNIRNLSQDEEKWFSGHPAVSDGTLTQNLYISRGYVLDANTVRSAIEKITKENIEMRTRYYKSKGTTLAIELHFCSAKVVDRLLANYSGETIEDRLDDMMAEDRKHPLDVESGGMMRVTVAKISKWVYAILVTQCLMLVNKWNVLQIFKEMWLPLNKVDRFYYAIKTEPHAWQRNMAAYWRNILLEGYHCTDVPYYKGRKTYYKRNYESVLVSNDELKALNNSINQRDRSQWVAFLAAIWALVIFPTKRTKDVGILVLDEAEYTCLSGLAVYDYISMLPMRIKVYSDMKCADYVKDVFEQFTRSQLVAQNNKEILFNVLQHVHYDHYISFQNFSIDKKYQDIEELADGATPVNIEYIDVQKDLALYPRMSEAGLMLEAYYNEACFTEYDMGRLMRRYHNMIISAGENWHSAIESIG